ncbi:tryptophan--tRNA ligase [Natrarchaeobius halalkaliphilus]|uniref:Tryptophan--tRNA ligase n=1 Tax=Natrarchaeobius halalkaliphilus TaxID=1679091 RepID=A0A3N6LZ28_9EURY|nr:tryptophan--tRNA ligase [Natrarchaeobius halalkaliphilus]RQG93144.1 tryptophan--tRNA ligase [Natrarchaeobius halalkaliphilus]
MSGDDPLEETESGESAGEERTRSPSRRWTESAAPSDDGAERVRTDGGAVDDVALDPWGSSSVSDYRKLFEEFGIEEFDDVSDEVPNPHYLMRRGVIFGHRDYRPVANAMANGEPAAVLSGFMPTGEPHIGHKLVFDEIIWHQQQGADAYALIADLEANSARGMSWAEIDEHTRNYLLSLLALGFDLEEGTLYRQSTNREVQDLAFDLGAEANFSEFEGIYGFDGETSVSHMQSVVTQMADILYPQLEEPKPTVIPVGPDQDPHVRLARDLAERMRFFKVTRAYASFELEAEERDLVAAFYDRLEPAEFDDDQLRCLHVAEALEATPLAELDIDASVLESVLTKLNEAGMEPVRPRTRFFDRRATEEAFEALIDAVEGEKRVYESHVDAFEIGREAAEELARTIEVENGGYGFRPPSSIYHRFMTGLTGGKMSSSIPASHISLLDDPETGYDKVKSATTGGRETAEEQREKGGRADECPVYELYAYLLAGDDDEFAKLVYDECVGGERLCGDCKEQAAGLMREFLEDHQEKRAEVADLLEAADIELESPRR